MRFMPCKKFSIQTSKTKEEIRKIIKSNTCSKRPSIFGASCGKSFWGRATDNCFIIKPVINYQNSFIPEIKLSFADFEDSLIINIKMNLLTYVSAFMYVWLGFCVIFELIFIANIANRGFSLLDFIPAVMFAFGCWLMHFAFGLEANKAEKRLIDLLSDSGSKELN